MRSKKVALTFGLSLTGICVSGMVYSFTFLSILSVCGKCLMVDCSSCVIDSSDDVTRRRMRHQMFLQVITPRKSLLADFADVIFFSRVYPEMPVELI